jgi:hypothetical protein
MTELMKSTFSKLIKHGREKWALILQAATRKFYVDLNLVNHQAIS